MPNVLVNGASVKSPAQELLDNQTWQEVYASQHEFVRDLIVYTSSLRVGQISLESADLVTDTVTTTLRVAHEAASSGRMSLSELTDLERFRPLVRCVALRMVQNFLRKQRRCTELPDEDLMVDHRASSPFREAEDRAVLEQHLHHLVELGVPRDHALAHMWGRLEPRNDADIVNRLRDNLGVTVCRRTLGRWRKKHARRLDRVLRSFYAGPSAVRA